MDQNVSFGSEDERLERVLQILRFKPDSEACTECLGSLDGYIAAQLAGEDYATRFPRVALHLDACTDCAGAYARLYELELAEENDALPQPETIPQPDLRFLKAGPQKVNAPINTELYDRLQDALLRTGDRIRLQFSADLLDFLRLLPSATPIRAPREGGRYDKVILQLNPAHFPDLDLPITLTAYRDAQQPDRCLVEILVEPPGESWPDLEGKLVTLIIAGERIESLTDAWGSVSFEGIRVQDLAEMKLEVSLQG